MACHWGIQMEFLWGDEWVWTRGIRWRFPGKFRIDPGWIIWNEAWSELPNGCELRALDENFLDFFQLDPMLVIWKDFW